MSGLVQRLHEVDHIVPNIHFAIPGCRSEAQANLAFSNWIPGYRSSAFGP
jgi:hypothetical protein